MASLVLLGGTADLGFRVAGWVPEQAAFLRLWPKPPPPEEQPGAWERLTSSFERLVPGVPLKVAGIGCFASALVATVCLKIMAMQARVLQRPYQIRDVHPNNSPQDPEAEFRKIVKYLQDTIMLPIDLRLPGRPFEFDFHSFPFTPMVLIIGNHSSGKSTFINNLLGSEVQETGVAPTDDGFTILERHDTRQIDDGPTVLGCPDNRPFKDLQRFGQTFSGHLRRKRLELPDGAALPKGLQIIDTPGMIDLPESQRNTIRGRGYNLVEVVRWWAKRADLILLLFDPDKPGTTGETLEVLTNSLAGLNHKFLVVLNKVDKLDNSLDFARAYGALGWSLSKVIQRKDIPQIYTMFNSGFDTAGDNKLPLEVFAKKRTEVEEEVFRVKDRHKDNIITALEETMRQMEMVCTVLGATRHCLLKRLLGVWICGLAVLVPPAAACVELYCRGQLALPEMVLQGMAAAYALLGLGVVAVLWDHFRQFERVQLTNLDETFEEAYAEFFIHNDGEDFRSRWVEVKPKVASILKSVPSVSALPAIPSWEVARIWECLNKDVWYLRQVARAFRRLEQQGQQSASPMTVLKESWPYG